MVSTLPLEIAGSFRDAPHSTHSIAFMKMYEMCLILRHSTLQAFKELLRWWHALACSSSWNIRNPSSCGSTITRPLECGFRRESQSIPCIPAYLTTMGKPILLNHAEYMAYLYFVCIYLLILQVYIPQLSKMFSCSIILKAQGFLMELTRFNSGIKIRDEWFCIAAGCDF